MAPNGAKRPMRDTIHSTILIRRVLGFGCCLLYRGTPQCPARPSSAQDGPSFFFLTTRNHVKYHRLTTIFKKVKIIVDTQVVVCYIIGVDNKTKNSKAGGIMSLTIKEAEELMTRIEKAVEGGRKGTKKDLKSAASWWLSMYDKNTIDLTVNGRIAVYADNGTSLYIWMGDKSGEWHILVDYAQAETVVLCMTSADAEDQIDTILNEWGL